MGSEGAIYIDQLFDKFYESADEKSPSLSCGQICWAPVQYLPSAIAVWRPLYIDDKLEFASSDYFQIIDNPKDLFSHNEPLKHPKPRRSNEEFLFSTAKRRPVIVINQLKIDEDIKQVRQGHKVQQDLCLVVPIYSISSDDRDKSKFHGETVKKTRLLYYHNLFFLPKYPGLKFRDSIARIDRIFSIPTQLLEPLPVEIAEEPFLIIKELLYLIMNSEAKPDSILPIYIDQIRNQ